MSLLPVNDPPAKTADIAENHIGAMDCFVAENASPLSSVPVQHILRLCPLKFCKADQSGVLCRIHRRQKRNCSKAALLPEEPQRFCSIWPSYRYFEISRPGRRSM